MRNYSDLCLNVDLECITNFKMNVIKKKQNECDQKQMWSQVNLIANECGLK